VGNRYTTVKPTGVVLVFVVFVGFVAVGGGFIDPFPTPLLVTLGSETRSGKKHPGNGWGTTAVSIASGKPPRKQQKQPTTRETAVVSGC